jgi:hypothetical protein
MTTPSPACCARWIDRAEASCQGKKGFHVRVREGIMSGGSRGVGRTFSSMKVRKKMEVRGAEVPSVVRMEVGFSISCLAWLKKEPEMKVTRKTVKNCSQRN